MGNLTLDEIALALRESAVGQVLAHRRAAHSHLDHALAIGLLADSVTHRRVNSPPIVVHTLPSTLAAPKAHIFNGVTWPDFTRLPTPEQPLLALRDGLQRRRAGASKISRRLCPETLDGEQRTWRAA